MERSVVSLEKMDIYNYEDALVRAKEAGDDTAALEKAYEAFRADGSITNMMNLRHLTIQYHPEFTKSKKGRTIEEFKALLTILLVFFHC